MDIGRIAIRFSDKNKDEVKLWNKIVKMNEKTGVSLSQVLKRSAYEALFKNDKQ